MPASKVPIIYSATTGRIRRFAVFDGAHETDADASAVRLGPGEALLIIARDKLAPLPVLQNLVTQACGLTPSDDRYAVVDDEGEVVAAVIADPIGCGDNVIGCELIKHDSAGPGWTKEGDTLQEPPPKDAP